jgi:XTP/dITP diphosphohydrolase
MGAMNASLRLVLATRNPGKVRELAALLAGLPVALVPCPPEAPEVIEDAATLEGNAEKKARALHAFTGVRSARFAGETATDADNRARLLAELHGQSDRRARFRTVLAFVDEAGALHTFAGVCAGRILDEERGAGGFGYDALFVPDGHAETFAEMTKEAKNRISHRALALAAFAAWLEQGGA